jgi:hypothetical protein
MLMAQAQMLFRRTHVTHGERVVGQFVPRRILDWSTNPGHRTSRAAQCWVIDRQCRPAFYVLREALKAIVLPGECQFGR